MGLSENDYPFLHAGNGVLVLDVYVQPGARKSGIVGLHGSALKIRVSSPPLDGRANKEIQHFLADLFHVPKGCISIQSGERSRSKRLAIINLPLANALAVLHLTLTQS